MHAVLALFICCCWHLYNVKYVFMILLSIVLINKRKLKIITYLSNCCIIICYNIIWYYSWYTVYNVHLQYIQCTLTVYTVCILSTVYHVVRIQRACLWRRGLHIDIPIPCHVVSFAVYRYHPTETHVSLSAIGDTCSNSEYILHECNNTL